MRLTSSCGFSALRITRCETVYVLYPKCGLVYFLMKNSLLGIWKKKVHVLQKLIHILLTASDPRCSKPILWKLLWLMRIKQIGPPWCFNFCAACRLGKFGVIYFLICRNSNLQVPLTWMCPSAPFFLPYLTVGKNFMCLYLGKQHLLCLYLCRKDGCCDVFSGRLCFFSTIR